MEGIVNSKIHKEPKREDAWDYEYTCKKVKGK